MFPENVRKEISYASIPVIPTLQDENLRYRVQVAFADSVRVLWYTLIGVSALGLAVSLLMKELPMQTTTDENWGLKDKKEKEKDGKDVDEKVDPATVV